MRNAILVILHTFAGLQRQGFQGVSAMKAVLCHSLDGPGALTMGDIPEPVPGPGEVTIRVHAASLNFYDTLMLRGKYQFKPELPFSPGGEVAGVIEAAGEGVTGFSAGQRVVTHMGVNGCREVAIADASGVVPIPDAVPDEIAAGLTVTYGTAVHGLADRGGLQAGETVAVLGASGGAGLAAVEIAKLMGARVIAAASSAEKLAVCKEHGADELIDYTREDLKERLRELTGGKGANVVYDCVGGPYAEPALRSTAWRGRYLVVGFAAGDIPAIPLNLLLLKGTALVGVHYGRFAKVEPEQRRAQVSQILAWCAQRKLRPHIHAIVPLEGTAEALAQLEARKTIGKIIVRP
jgi:NADPH2:quinone reductase